MDLYPTSPSRIFIFICVSLSFLLRFPSSSFLLRFPSSYTFVSYSSPSCSSFLSSYTVVSSSLFVNMASSCWSGSTMSSPSKLRPNLQYEPSLYCRCGLKSPLCVSRDNGQQFFGCQRWKEGGCGFFLWKSSLLKEGDLESNSNTKVELELKNMKHSIIEEIQRLRSDVQKAIQVEVESKNRQRNILIGLVIIVGIGVYVILQKKAIPNGSMLSLV